MTPIIYDFEDGENMKDSEQNNLKKIYELILKNSFEHLLKNDYMLLGNNVHEVAISSKLAQYINSFMSIDPSMENGKLNVDIEYNRMPDINNHEMQGQISKAIYIMSFDVKRQDLHKEIRRNVRPDIIIHQRKTNANNILWLELKLNVDERECRFDMQKAWYAILQLQYKLGLSILVNIKKQIIVFNWINLKEVERVEYEIKNGLLNERNRLISLYTPV